ncbi:hypothetical protein CBP16_08730, partial [Fischerella thermalis WC217]
MGQFLIPCLHHLPHLGDRHQAVITLFRKLRTAFATKDRLPQDNSSRSWLQTVLITSVGVTILVLGVRHLKWLQTWELAAYDQMIRLRPAEPPD